LWPSVFFGYKNILIASIVILFLDRYVYLTIIEFFKISKIAFWLLIPYFIWILFATYLTIAYLFLN